MKIEFTREQRITNALMLHSTSITDIGLLHGKIGIAIYFHHLARQSGKSVFSEFANELIDQVTESLSNETPFDFESGITGIGWAVEYLIKNGFVEADADDILEEFDSKVNQVLIHSKKDLATTLAIGHYLNARLRYRIEDEDNQRVLDLKYQTILYIDELERQIHKTEPSAEIAYLLAELHKLNIYNYKIEKLQRYVGAFEYDYLFPMVKRLTPEQIDELLNAKDVPSKYAGYNLATIPEEQRWGLLNGIAEIGLQNIMRNE